MKAFELNIFILLIISIYSFDFGKTLINLTNVNGGTATLKIYPQNNGTTAGSDLTISNLKLACYPSYYDLTCISNKQIQLLSTGTEIQCSISVTIPTTKSCALVNEATITSTGDTFIPIDNLVPVKNSKFGNTQIGLVSVEGKKTIIKIYPERSGETTTDDLFIQDLIVNNKALTCKANKKIKLEANTGTELVCSTSEEIDANIECSLSGTPKIFSTRDTFDKITYRTKTVYSLFGKVKVGLIMAKGTSITLEFISEYKGIIKLDISGLLNDTRVIDCPYTSLSLSKEGVNLECSIAQAVNDGDLCVLSEINVNSYAISKLEINEEKNKFIAKSSKYGEVNIFLKSVYGYKVTILVQTSYFGVTESNKFVIQGLKLHVLNSVYQMTCSFSSKINFVEQGTNLTCTLGYTITGGKECKLEGVAIFNSEGDTFSDIKVSSDSVLSSFGKITIYLQSVIGKNVKIKFASEFSGTTSSSIISINNLKLNNENLTCPIGVNINFSDKPIFTCTLTQDMEGNIYTKLRGDNPIIINPENSKDVFGQIVLYDSTVVSSLGKLQINLISVVAGKITIGLVSEYIGSTIGLIVYDLYVNNHYLRCKSTGKTLIFKDKEGNSNANIECEFDYSFYSQQSNTTCTLTGTPSTNKKLFTSISINSTTVTSGIRNFGETIIYLYSIKGTTLIIQMTTSLNGVVRPYISNLKLKGGNEIYDVKCDVAAKIQLYNNYRTKIKCYIPKTINENTYCNLIRDNVTITSDSEDLFGNAIISTETINIKPNPPNFGNTKITLTSVVGTQVNINIQVSSTTLYTNANPIIHGLYIGSSELYCASTNYISFTNNMAQMSCTSSTAITCTNNCQLSGSPVIINSGDDDRTFGDTTLITKTVTKTQSTLGNVSLSLKQVIGNTVYIGITSTNNAKNIQNVNIRNLYVDGQSLQCDDNIEFSISGTQMKCTVAEPIPYNKAVTLTGTPSIKINSEEESVDLVELTSTQTQIISRSTSALIIKLISVKENIVIISIIANSLTEKTIFNHFSIIGLSINDIPFEVKLDNISLSNNENKILVKLNETIPRDVPCELKGVTTSQILADATTFGPITSPASNLVNSSSFKFGNAYISASYIQGYSVILKIQTSKSDYTKNTEINGLYINDTLPLVCKLKDDIELNSEGTYIECKLDSPMKPNSYCILSYKNNNENDDNFENIEIYNPKSLWSQYKYFGKVTIGLKEVSGKNVKIFVKTEKQNITTTNNIKINNLYINKQKIICEFDDYIEFEYKGNELNCKLESFQNAETYNLTGSDIEIISFGDSFGNIVIDEKNKTVKSTPKEIEDLTISLSSIAFDKANIRLKSTDEVYTNIKISNLKIKNINNLYTYNLNCPKVYIDLEEKNSYTDIITCDISTKLNPGYTFSLIDNSKEITIESFDKFENIIIETNEIKSTKFGDININYVDSSIVLNISSIYQGKTYSSINIGNIQLNSSLALDCSSLESIEIKPTGTIVYCNLRGINTIQGINNKPPYIISVSSDDTYSNIFLNQKTNNNLKSANCYAIYNKTSCESNNNCIFTKDTYGYCGYKYNYTFNSITNISENNSCILYINKDACNNDNKCIWNEENKYSCKTKQIMNCKKLNKNILNYCDECIIGYTLNSEKTECRLNDININSCMNYYYSSCIGNPRCEYSYYSFYFCSNKADYETDNKCYLYITKESCNSIEGCLWKSHSGEHCKEKYINNCLKLKESNPSLCDKCEDGYTLLNGKECLNNYQEKRDNCLSYSDNKEECLLSDFCEYSNRDFCFGEGNCYLIMDENLCENTEPCHWIMEDLDKCQLKKIDGCSKISTNNFNKCEKCKDGYYLSNENTQCKSEYKNEYTYPICWYEDDCLEDDRCEYTDRNFCESNYEDYNSINNCSLFLDKEKCENFGESRCVWANYTEKVCKIKNIENCLELNYNNTHQCIECKSGYKLNDEKTQCTNFGNYIIALTMMQLFLIIILF